GGQEPGPSLPQARSPITIDANPIVASTRVVRMRASRSRWRTRLRSLVVLLDRRTHRREFPPPPAPVRRTAVRRLPQNGSSSGLHRREELAQVRDAAPIAVASSASWVPRETRSRLCRAREVPLDADGLWSRGRLRRPPRSPPPLARRQGLLSADQRG